MTAAYLLHISVEDDNEPTQYRVLVDEVAYRFIEDGGEVPAKVLADAAFYCGITYTKSALKKAQKWKFCDKSEHFILRALLATPSSFNGRACNANSMNALTKFATKHKLDITEASYNASEDHHGAIDWYAIRDDHLAALARAPKVSKR